MTAICLLMFSLSSDAYLDVYERGNAAYGAEHYNEAVTAYEHLAASGVWNAALYFNLGNACYHEGDLGRAILNYERAIAIDPDFQPARRNLDFAISKTARALGRPVGFGLEGRSPSRVPGLTQPMLRGLLMVFWWLLWGILIRSIRSTVVPRRVAVLLWILAMGLCAMALTTPVTAIRSAVVMVPEVPLRYGPDPLDGVRARLDPGDRVLVDRVEGVWARVETASGDRGWLELGNIALLGPPFSQALTDREKQVQ